MEKTPISELEYLGPDYTYGVVQLVLENDIEHYKDILKEGCGLDDMDTRKEDLEHLMNLFDIDRNDSVHKFFELLTERNAIIDKINREMDKLDKENI